MKEHVKKFDSAASISESGYRINEPFICAIGVSGQRPVLKRCAEPDMQLVVSGGSIVVEEVPPTVVLDEVYGGEEGYCVFNYTADVAHKISNAYIKDDYDDETYPLTLVNGANTEYITVNHGSGETHTFTVYYTVGGTEIMGNSQECWCYHFECFPAGTLVTTNKHGFQVPIETLKSGDHVLARNMVTGANELAVIDYPFETYSDRTALLKFDDNSELRTSIGHPVYTTDGWKSCSPHLMQNGEQCNQLVVGDQVLTELGTKTLVSIQYIDERIKMYSLDMSFKYNNFFANHSLVYESPLYTRQGVDGDTLVIMEDGTTKAIKDVQAGDFVIATRKSNGELEPAIVKQVYKLNNTGKVIRVTLTDGTDDKNIILLPEQCMYTIDGWKSVNEVECEGTLTNLLKVGDVVVSDDDSTLTVKAIKALSGRNYDMWEIDIDDDFDNYYISFDVIEDINENGLEIGEKKNPSGLDSTTCQRTTDASQHSHWMMRMHNREVSGEYVLPDGAVPEPAAPSHNGGNDCD
jgi:hypothetical protein